MKPLRNDIDIKGLENLKRGEGVDIGNNTKYEYGSELSTEGIPLIDPGQGKTLSIRAFTYKINPEKLRVFPTNKQLIFSNHAKEIERILWGDGLIPFDESPPRVIIDLKKGIYQILVPCEAKRGVLFMEKPKNLSTELAKQAKNGKLDSQRK